MGTIEVTRLGMGEAQMESIADFIAYLPVERGEPETIANEVIAFREPYQTLYYCFEHGLPDHT